MDNSKFTIDGAGKEHLSCDLSRISQMMLEIRGFTIMDQDPDQVLGAIQALSEKAGYMSDKWLRHMGGVIVVGNYDVSIGLTDEGMPTDED
jgi:hypothetical protein